jgi:hypothetical protein
MKIEVYWDVRPCRLVNIYRRYRACCFHCQKRLICVYDAVRTGKWLPTFRRSLMLASSGYSKS